MGLYYSTLSEDILDYVKSFITAKKNTAVILIIICGIRFTYQKIVMLNYKSKTNDNIFRKYIFTAII